MTLDQVMTDIAAVNDKITVVSTGVDNLAVLIATLKAAGGATAAQLEEVDVAVQGLGTAVDAVKAKEDVAQS